MFQFNKIVKNSLILWFLINFFFLVEFVSDLVVLEYAHGGELRNRNILYAMRAWLE